MITQQLPIKLWFFYKIHLLGFPSGGCFPHEKIGVPNSKDCQTLSVPTEVCKADWGVLIAHDAVEILWHPWVGLRKKSQKR